ncbi:MAG TPA: BolA family protein [Usitatibacteraceae bacterium]|nr:BolA family protein [Usitatibacteraceae bacterium]
MNLESAIRERLAVLEPQSVALVDEDHLHVGHGATGAHWQLTIVSEAFRGKPLLARHRMVYEALGDLMKREIHALKIEAFAPEQF